MIHRTYLAPGVAANLLALSRARRAAFLWRRKQDEMFGDDIEANRAQAERMAVYFETTATRLREALK